MPPTCSRPRFLAAHFPWSQLVGQAVLLVCVLLPLRICGAERPNVILIMSDDQGVGDYGFQGNSVIRTPALDAMRSRGGLLNQFYVSPVCAPTRASLMTGRYNYRTRCIDTYLGRAMMDTEEVTIAELLRDAGYRTGIYGKWHLGDNYPLRPMDQGFEDSLVHRGGGIGQSSDPIGAEGKYTNPTLIKNGVETPMQGYCTDLYFDAAMEFMERSVGNEQPFFAYIATNAPHGPFHDVPPELYQEYLRVDMDPIRVDDRQAARSQPDADTLARIAAMITNIDENVGRLMDRLQELKVFENTLVMYLNDNGPNTWRYVGDMRGKKTGVDDGGVRSPLIVHWPDRITAGRELDIVAAHIDVLPSVLEACDVALPGHQQLDGRSFLPWLEGDASDWPERTLVLQAYRGNRPQRYHHFALHSGPWKLVHPSGFGREQFSGNPQLELYNLAKDPQQQHDLASTHSQLLGALKAKYDAWFDDVSSTRPNNYAPPRIIVGSPHEVRSTLTRQDWRPASGAVAPASGAWWLKAEKGGAFEVELILREPLTEPSTATITVDSNTFEVHLAAERQRGHMVTLDLPTGEFQIAAEVAINGKWRPVHQLIVERK